MTCKPKLLFVIDSLNIGGAERSLINLLSYINYNEYEIDLQLFSLEGEFFSSIPKKVNILKLPIAITLLHRSLFRNNFLKSFFWKRCLYSIIIRVFRLNNSTKSVIFWFLFKSIFPRNNKLYDFAFAYSQGIPSFFTIDNINAKKKFLWLNTDYKLGFVTKKIQKNYYRKADKIILVSEVLLDYFSKKIFPDLRNKMFILTDLINYDQILTLSKEGPIIIKDEFPMLLTIARLEKEPKGYDILIKVAKTLKSRNINFRWYIIGTGTYKSEFEKLIKENKLSDSICLLGSILNPYSYLSQSDIYIQPSRREGFGLTVAEAKIFNKPCVLTPFNTATIHVTNGKNGLISSSFIPEDITNLIEKLIKDKTLYNKIVDELNKEKKNNKEEIKKFYDLLYQ